MVRVLPYLLALLLGVGAAGLTACGQKENKALIPSADAGPLKQDFDDVSSAVGDHDCPAASKAVDSAQNHLNAINGSLSVRLRNRLQDGIDELRKQAAGECVEQTTTTETIQTVTEPVTTETETTDTTATETVPTTTTTETLPPATTEVTPPPTTEQTPPPVTDPGDTGGVITP